MSVWEHFTNQKQWEKYLKDLLKQNDKALLRAIVLIYENQTKEEKLIGASVEENKTGFNRLDAEEMSFIARKLKRGEKINPHELIRARLIMPKYWKQLMVISKKNMEAKKTSEVTNNEC